MKSATFARRVTGSSPRRRGKPGKSFLLRAVMGLIPA